MGCGGSKKLDDLPLVVLCRERKDLIKAASDHRYALAAAHLSYFRSLKDVGDALCRFVEEEIVIASSSSSPSSASPVLTLPSDEGKAGNRQKSKRKLKGARRKSSSSSSSVPHSLMNEDSHHTKVEVDAGDDELDNSHLRLSSSDSEVSSSGGHIEIEDSPELGKPSSPPKHGVPRSPQVMGYAGNSYGPYNPYYSYPYNPYYSYNPNSSYTVNYMKKSTTAIPSMIYEEPKQNPIFTYSGYPGYPPFENAGYFGFTMNQISPADSGSNRQQSQPRPPPTPPSPKVSAWDYFNPFDGFDNNTYPNYYSQSRYGSGSNTSSPDSAEIREREGIPDLEEETESEVIKESSGIGDKKKVQEDFNRFYRDKNKNRNKNVQFAEGEGDNFREGPSKAVPVHHAEEAQPVEMREVKSSSPDFDTSISNRMEEVPVKNKGVSFEVDGAAPYDIGSSKASSLTTLSSHGMRDLREVAKEIKEEFEAATDYGKEVSKLLEAGKLPYRSQSAFFRVVFARFFYSVAPSMSCSYHPSTSSAPSSSNKEKIVEAFSGDSGNGTNTSSLSSTLEKLYVWEKKLYKEVKDEERIRFVYEKKCKKLKMLDERGAETSKIEATQASIRKLLTKLNVSIRAVDAIASRIHKLRDEELQPHLKELIYGLRKMWKSMLKCHQKQFQAILESKTRVLKANTGLRRDSSVRATVELEMELLKWRSCFIEWIHSQRFYAESLNGWLLRCLLHVPEETPDGIVPFSPGRIGAPPVFVICNDWSQAMERISEAGVKTAMHDFAASLHQMWERQDEEQLQRVKAEYALKDFEKQIQNLRMEKLKTRHEHDAYSDKASFSMVQSDSGISPLDDLKVDLDSIRQKVLEERAVHKEAVKLVHDAVSRSVQAGLVPIFEALESFTSEALKAYEDVRLEDGSGDS
ncbi:hypothetical protein Ancab_037339 [Ancistrocladus abbreviatus]